MSGFTKARREMLETVAKKAGAYASYYPPLKWLWAQGLVEEYGNRGGLFRITPKGSERLSELNKNTTQEKSDE